MGPHHWYRAPPEAVSGRDPSLVEGIFAGVAELVDAVDLGSTAEKRGGSSPSARTKKWPNSRISKSF